MLTLTLALGIEPMSHRSAVVRRLSAVEALGSVTGIATDKTATLLSILADHGYCVASDMEQRCEPEPQLGRRPLSHPPAPMGLTCGRRAVSLLAFVRTQMAVEEVGDFIDVGLEGSQLAVTTVWHQEHFGTGMACG